MTVITDNQQLALRIDKQRLETGNSELPTPMTLTRKPTTKNSEIHTLKHQRPTATSDACNRQKLEHFRGFLSKLILSRIFAIHN
jgi:hypothetical protein